MPFARLDEIYEKSSRENIIRCAIERQIRTDANFVYLEQNGIELGKLYSGNFGSKPPINLRTRDIEDCSPRANLTLKEIHILHYFGKSLS